MKPEKKIQELLARKMARAASDKELNQLHKLLQQNPKYYFLIEILQAIEVEKYDTESLSKEKDLIQESWQRLSGELDKPITSNNFSEAEKSTRRGLIRAWLPIAAVWTGIVLLLAGSYIIKRKKPNEEALKGTSEIVKQLFVPYGGPEKKLLPDSTIVWINAGSRIRYADNFIQKNRDVYLDGEAYFSVKHDRDHPFIVHVGNVTIRALGTRFNVHGYPDENVIEATLISGKIQVEIDDKPDKKIILNPNEKIIVCNEGLSLADKKDEPRKELGFQVREVTPVTDLTETAWLQDKLAFQNESFEELAKRMERRYDVSIIFKDSLLEKERLTGVFKNENIMKALRVLQLTTPFNYQFQRDTVYLKR